MKPLFLPLAVGAMLAACSAPRYGYFTNNTKTYTSKTDAPHHIQNETLIASTSKAVLVQRVEVDGIALQTPKPPLPKIIKSERKTLKSVLKELRTTKRQLADSLKKGDKSKNGYSVAGFILSFSPIVGTLIAAYLSPGTGVGIVLGGIGFAFAVLCCSIGLRSQKKGLAKAGFGVMITETILLIAGIIIAIGIANSIN